jgi:hypothetical protein
MAKFLVTTGVSFHLEELIKTANERLVLISPFLKMNDRIKELLDDKDRLKLDIRLIYGKNELLPEENNWLKTKNFIRTSFCKNLHAKCFLNEKEALLTSMNLYDFSQVNNNEMGIYVIKSEEPELYFSIYEEANRLIRISDEVKVSVERIVPRESQSKNTSHQTERTGSKISLPDKGFCIRCKAAVKLDPKHPLCKECYGVWKKFGDPNFEEKRCHICGKTNKSTLLKPTCYDCYKTYKDVLPFSV